MASFKLEPRQKIVVCTPQDEQPYQSVIEDVSGTEILISIPLSETSPLPARPGDLLTVRIPMQSHCLEFTAPVLGIRIDPVPRYSIRYPEEIKRVQLRQDVRIDVLLDLLYSLPPDPGADPEFKKAMAVNLSAGGMKISVSDPVPEGSSIIVKFHLPVKKYVHSFEIEAVVVRSQAIENKDQMPMHHLGLSFQNINSKQKDLIYQYIFNKMSELKKTGRL